MHYPFTALVGQEPLKTALLLNAIDPAIGGVLIRGEKGTAKSTAARALAALLPPLRLVSGCPFRCDPAAPAPSCPHCAERVDQEMPAVEGCVPFVELPLGATEDRVLGSLDLERALHEGRRAFQPGLLAAAHRGILYVDEVNLLPDHLVDVLLDAAAMGVNVVQREGVAISHPARFLLVGTMNPEEGELRPQLLDRFGLMVEVSGPRDTPRRVEVVRRRIAFESDPGAFGEQWREEQDRLRKTIADARERLADVVLEDELLVLICEICCEVGVEGLRADITMHRTARALAALASRTTVIEEDVREAAGMALPHRRSRRPHEPMGLDPRQLDDLVSRDQQGRDSSGDQPEETPDASAEKPRGDQDGGPSSSGVPEEAEPSIFGAAPADPVRPIRVIASDRASRGGRGRRNAAAASGRGRYTRAVLDEAPRPLAVDATLRSAALNGLDDDGRPRITRGDLHRKELTAPAGTLILFVVDASGSMAARSRMEAVKGAVLSLLRDARDHRDRVGVIAFRGLSAEVLLSPSGSGELAEQALRSLPTGGRTPLAHALVLASDVVRTARRSDPDLLVMPVLLTDGKANVGLPGQVDAPWEQALDAAARLAGEGVAPLVLDTDAGFIRLGRAGELARALDAACLPLEELTAESVALQVRQHRRAAALTGRRRLR